MSRRERPVSGPAEAPPRPARGNSAPAVSVPSESTPGRQPSLEAIFRECTPLQQREMLALAQRQGLLYAHQLPTPSNGAPLDRGRQVLAQLLRGQTDHLEPVRPADIQVADQILDALQREAVAKALATPDLCLIQGLPGTGKSRLIAELAWQVAGRGGRVLLLGSTAAALDRVLEPLHDREPVFALRLLDRDEPLDHLPAPVRGLTVPERLERWQTEILPRAQQQLREAESTCAQLEQEAGAWPDMEAWAEEWEKGQELRTTIETGLVQLETRVAAEADDPSASSAFARHEQEIRRKFEGERDSIDQAGRELESRIEHLRQEAAQLDEQWQELSPLIEAKRKHQFWRKAWWQATRRGLGGDQAAEVETARAQNRKSLDQLEEQLAALQGDRARLEQEFTIQRLQRMSAEIACRREDLEAQKARLEQSLATLAETWKARLEPRLAPGRRLPVPTRSDLLKAREAWHAEQRQAAETLAFQQRWLRFLEQEADRLPDQWLSYANVVAVTTAALTHQPKLLAGTATDASGPAAFDLLIMDEADQLTESELLGLARHATRWVLIGEPPWDQGPSETKSSAAPAPASRGLGTILERSRVFHRLWQALHCDPRTLPYDWGWEGDRLRCRLRMVPAEQRAHLEVEHVADFPDIELRILTLPRSRPALAEVLFPKTMPIEAAKQYIFQELEELAVRATGHSLRWDEDSERLILRLAASQMPHEVSVDLAPGVRETLGAATVNGCGSGLALRHTCCLEFDRTAGWQRPQAEDWIRRHLGLRDLGRTVCLDLLHRMQPPLAAIVADWLGTGTKETSPRLAVDASPGVTAAVQFIPVPALTENSPGLARPQSETSGAARAGNPRSLASLLPRKGGAGLELDLADVRQRDRLPAELRPHLPATGIVNYFEAQAVVRVLRQLIIGEAADPRAVMVVALYASQAVLIRRLLQETPELATCAGQIEVGAPAQWRQREAATVLVSLTRSHTHRAVAFGDGPRALATAFTRARHRLLVFGDPGTLLRRCAWEGPLEHLDQATAGREQRLLAGLVRYLQGSGTHAAAFQLRQGSGS